MQDFTDANNLIKAFGRVKKASGWKESTQRYGLNLLRETRALQRELRAGEYEQREETRFRLCERGHLRLVRALKNRDMVMQHSLCDNVLVPGMAKYIIHDNGACLKGKGLSFTRRRFLQHLAWHVRRHGAEGYVLQIDFAKYFDNIRHDALRKLIRDRPGVTDAAMAAVDAILRANRVDVSYTDSPGVMDEVFSSLDYEKVDKSLLTGERFMEKSLGIGSPVSQISGIAYPLRFDNYCKNVEGLRCYDAYMDDRIIIHPSKEYLKGLLERLEAVAAKQGLFIHPRKTRITKLSHGFTFLKTRYRVAATGRIIRLPPRDVFTRQRRKMKKLARFVGDGRLPEKEFCGQYKSWRQDKLRHYDAYRAISKMDKVFRRLLKWTRNMKPSGRSGRR